MRGSGSHLSLRRDETKRTNTWFVGEWIAYEEESQPPSLCLQGLGNGFICTTDKGGGKEERDMSNSRQVRIPKLLYKEIYPLFHLLNFFVLEGRVCVEAVACKLLSGEGRNGSRSGIETSEVSCPIVAGLANQLG